MGKNASGSGLWELIDNSQLADKMAEMKTGITEAHNEITQTVNKTLEDRAPPCSEYSACRRTQMMTAALYVLKVQKTKDGIPMWPGLVQRLRILMASR